MTAAALTITQKTLDRMEQNYTQKKQWGQIQTIREYDSWKKILVDVTEHWEVQENKKNSQRFHLEGWITKEQSQKPIKNYNMT